MTAYASLGPAARIMRVENPAAPWAGGDSCSCGSSDKRNAIVPAWSALLVAWTLLSSCLATLTGFRLRVCKEDPVGDPRWAGASRAGPRSRTEGQRTGVRLCHRHRLQQGLRLHRLDEVAADVEVIALQHVALLVGRGHHHDRDRSQRRSLHATQDLDAIDPRRLDVKQHELGRPRRIAPG